MIDRQMAAYYDNVISVRIAINPTILHRMNQNQFYSTQVVAVQTTFFCTVLT